MLPLIQGMTFNIYKIHVTLKHTEYLYILKAAFVTTHSNILIKLFNLVFAYPKVELFRQSRLKTYIFLFFWE